MSRHRAEAESSSTMPTAIRETSARRSPLCGRSFTPACPRIDEQAVKSKDTHYEHAEHEHAGHREHHEHHDHAAQRVPSDPALQVLALESLLVDKGLVDPQALDALVESYEHKIGPHNGAKVVARAWTDPAYKARLLADATSAIAEFGFGGLQGEHTLAGGDRSARGVAGVRAPVARGDADPRLGQHRGAALSRRASAAARDGGDDRGAACLTRHPRRDDRCCDRASAAAG